MEQSTFNEKEIKMGSERVTNAQSYWAAYNRSPATTMKLLEIKIKPYEKKLHLSRPGLYYKLQKEKSEIINMLHDVAYFEKVADRALEYDFIFGYQAEVNFIFIKQEEEK